MNATPENDDDDAPVILHDPGGFAGAVFKDGDPAALRFMLNDSILSLVRVFKHVSTANPDPTIPAFIEKLIEDATTSRAGFINIIVRRGDDLTNSQVETLCGLCLRHLIAQPGPTADNLSIMSLYWPNEGRDPLLDQAFEAAKQMADYMEKGTGDSPLKISELFLSLARMLPPGSERDAFACAASGMLWLEMTSLRAHPEALDFYLETARATNDPIPIAVALTTQFVAAARRAETSSTFCLEAFDTCERCFRFAFVSELLPNSIRAAVQMALSKPYLAGFKVPYLMLTDPRVQAAPDIKFLNLFFKPIWTGTAPDWLTNPVLDFRRQLTVDWEQKRVPLLSPLGAFQPLASWDTWEVGIPAFRHAVPLSTDLLTDPSRAETVMLTVHETTHRLCFTGPVGRGYRALQWAAYETEVRQRILHHGPNQEVDKEAILLGRIPAALGAASGLALALAERALELERKAQVLRAIWASWMEGVALFAETADCPDLNPEAYSPVAGVTRNLLDVDPTKLPQDEALRIKFLFTHFEKVDQILGEVMRQNARPRLRTYLSAGHDIYLAGYLAVRRVVSCWRRTMGKRGLAGYEAFEILLHVTRFSADGMLPHLALPLDQFRREASSAHLQWVAALCAISAEDISALISSHRKGKKEERSTFWLQGRLQPAPENDASAFREAHLYRFAEEAMLSGRENYYDRERAGGNPALLEAAADLVTKFYRDHTIFKPQAFGDSLAGKALLVLGTTQAYFWLIASVPAFGCSIRTHADPANGDTWKAKYWQMPLSMEKYAKLEALVRAGGPGRMTVLRVADITPGDVDFDGIHYLVFRYEDWTEVMVVGGFLGSSLESSSVRSEVDERFAKKSIVKAMESLNNSSHPCANRTLEWIRSREWSDPTGEKPDLTAWSNRVSHLAEEVISDDDNTLRRQTNEELLQWVFGNDTTARKWSREGPAELESARPGLLRDWIKFLTESALQPVASAENLENELAGMGIPMLNQLPSGWDFLPKQ